MLWIPVVLGLVLSATGSGTQRLEVEAQENSCGMAQALVAALRAQLPGVEVLEAGKVTAAAFRVSMVVVAGGEDWILEIERGVGEPILKRQLSASLDCNTVAIQAALMVERRLAEIAWQSPDQTLEPLVTPRAAVEPRPEEPVHAAGGNSLEASIGISGRASLPSELMPGMSLEAGLTKLQSGSSSR